ncbi:uncharacterized protein SCHCODRAFT_01158666 [Schizophyllum commune H4-8]|nr:uncharacterized protein SCHCODRAFT_01158666 [Schizophyllum commune H4-8]KAI5888112.1 hypothetical protein SCHCODRAFT_01158666 [Schizophyllum commune H4-8]
MSTADDRAIACLAALVSRPRFAFLADRYVALAEATTRLQSVLQSTDKKIQESKRARLPVNASRAGISRGGQEVDVQQDTVSDGISGQLSAEARRTRSTPLRGLSRKPSLSWGDADKGDMLELPAASLNAQNQLPPPSSPQAPEHRVCNSCACLPALEASPMLNNEGYVAISTDEGPLCSAESNVMAGEGSGVSEPRGTIVNGTLRRNEACAEADANMNAMSSLFSASTATNGYQSPTDDLACADSRASLSAAVVALSSTSPQLQQMEGKLAMQLPLSSAQDLRLSPQRSSSLPPSVHQVSFRSRGAISPSGAENSAWKDTPRKSARLAAQSHSAGMHDAPSSRPSTALLASSPAAADFEADPPSKRRRSTRLASTDDHSPSANDQCSPEIDEALSSQSDGDESYIDEGDPPSAGDLTRPYACTACDVAFTKASYLQRHLRDRAHNSEGGAHRCTLCGARFVRVHHLRRHLSSAAHGDERGFTCSVAGCTQAFTRREHLKRHLQNVHKR